MSFLYLLEKLRAACPPLAYLFGALTYLGDEAAFLAVAVIVLWCVSKREGYYLLTVGFLGTILNQFLKIICRVPRPWQIDPGFSIFEPAREAATGYSFPSGHTQNATGTYGGLAMWHGLRASGRARILWFAIPSALIVLVAFSRMFLGVHAPADVLTSLGIGLLLVLLLHPFFERERSPLTMVYGVAAMAGLALLYLLFVELFPHPADVDVAHLYEARKNGYTLLGAVLGVLVMTILEWRGISYDTKATPLGQLVKTVPGLLLVLGVKEGLKPFLALLFGEHPAAALPRYFLLVLFAGFVWPLTFRRLGTLRLPKGKSSQT